jgi:NADH:ubiquinone oxidoreductase subunit E
MKQRMPRITGAILMACALFLFADYAIAHYQLPKQDARILALQKEVKEDAAKAPVLEAYHKSVTDGRWARSRRVHVMGWIMLITGAGFLLTVPKKGHQAIELQRMKALQDTPAPRLHIPPGEAEPAGIDLRVVDDIIARLGREKESAIPVLQAIQTHFRYLPDEALKRVCETTSITPQQIAGTSSFYTQFRTKPVGRHVVRVCHGTACHVSGARQITEELHRTLDIKPGQDTDDEREFTVVEVACLGCCSLAPVLMVDEQTAGKLSPVNVREMFPSRQAK